MPPNATSLFHNKNVSRLLYSTDSMVIRQFSRSNSEARRIRVHSNFCWFALPYCILFKLRLDFAFLNYNVLGCKRMDFACADGLKIQLSPNHIIESVNQAVTTATNGKCSERLTNEKVHCEEICESMSGHRGNIGSRPAREVFLTSSSLSFSSLSSSVSWDDAIELNTKESKASREDKIQKNGELLNASSSQGSEMSSITHVRMQPAPSPPSRLQPVPLMDKGIWDYDPQRIPASAFGKTGDMTWSEISNESLFSLKFDGYRKSNAQASRQSNIKAEEILMLSGEYLKYTPSLLVKPGDAEAKRSEVKEIKSGETRVESRHEEKSSSTPDVSLSTNPNNSYSLNQVPPTKDQSCSLLVGERKSKKRKKTRKSKKKKKKEKKAKKKEKKKKKKKKCCIWSWLCSVFSKCECDLRCYKWGKCSCCCRGPKTMVVL